MLRGWLATAAITASISACSFETEPISPLNANQVLGETGGGRGGTASGAGGSPGVAGTPGAGGGGAGAEAGSGGGGTSGAGGASGTGGTGGISGGTGGTGGIGPEDRCVQGATRECQPSGCARGIETCGANSLWGACISATATPETDCDELDDDCDGTIDEGCPCRADEQQPCYGGPPDTADVGPCRAGYQACEAGRWGGCRDAVLPQDELCDGADNDCDGALDESDPGIGASCDTGVPGLCQSGATRCGAGALVCEQMVDDAPERCNGQDDDCDGTVDEDFAQGGVYLADDHCGACGMACGGTLAGSATEACAAFGSGARCEVVSCQPGYARVDALTCRRLVPNPCGACSEDADCPAAGDACLDLGGERVCGIDCGADNAYGNPAGQCPDGYTCAELGARHQCVPPSNSCSCLATDDGRLRDCTRENEHGVCAGQQRCDATEGWSMCDAELAGPEACNDFDDDCDGMVDEADPGGGGTCDTGGMGSCAVGSLECVEGEITCVPRTPPSAELCGNQADDNCDGRVDEGCCPHNECSMGPALPPSCSGCVQLVCQIDFYCCDPEDGGWDGVCVSHAARECGCPQDP